MPVCCSNGKTWYPSCLGDTRVPCEGEKRYRIAPFNQSSSPSARAPILWDSTLVVTASSGLS